MNKAAQLSAKLEKVKIDEGMQLIEESSEEAISSALIEDVICIMHDDGSVNIFEVMDNGAIIGEVISSPNILKVLHHYRPFKEVFKGNLQ